MADHLFHPSPLEDLNIALLDKEDAQLTPEEVMACTGMTRGGNRTILIHCRGGMYRSCSLIVAHWMVHEGLTLT